MTCDAHFRTRMSYSSQKSCVKICFGLVESFKSHHLNFPGRGGGGERQKPPIRRVTCDLQRPFSTWPSYSSQKSCVKIWFGLVEPFKSYGVHKHFSGGGQKSPMGGGGLKLTCDAYFPTRMSYSSQKSCVKIWFRLVEIGARLMLKGAEDPY